MYSRAAQPQQKSSVITQAINDKNTPMVIKNLILKMKEQMKVNDDQFPELIKEVENYTNSCADSASVAVLHSMLAEMYQNYYQRNQWTKMCIRDSAFSRESLPISTRSTTPFLLIS